MADTLHSRHRCRACGQDGCAPLIDFGAHPIAHRLARTISERVEIFPLALEVCPACGLVQIIDPIPPERLYRDYNFCFSGWKAQPHIEDELDQLLAGTNPDRPPALIEIACNDGLFLRAARERGIARLVGVEPNPHAVRIARQEGLVVENGFLTPAYAADLVQRHGRFDRVVARQVIEHIPDLPGFLTAITMLLAPGGVLMLDLPDSDFSFAQGDGSSVWEEHVSYFTEPVLHGLLARHGFVPRWSKRYDFSGTCLAMTASRADHAARAAPTASVIAEALRLAQGFPDRFTAYGRSLASLLSEKRALGWKIGLYGAGCRACGLVNFHRLHRLIDIVIDDQSERQGLFLPAPEGENLPIQPLSALSLATPWLVLLAVNNEHEAKVAAKLQATGISVQPLPVLGPRPLGGAEDILAALRQVG